MTQEPTERVYTVITDKRIVRTQSKYFLNEDATQIYPANLQFNGVEVGVDYVVADGWTLEDGAVSQVKLDLFICGAHYSSHDLQLLAWAP